MSRKFFRLLSAALLASLLMALVLSSLAAPVRSQTEKPAPLQPNARSGAASYDGQLPRPGSPTGADHVRSAQLPFAPERVLVKFRSGVRFGIEPAGLPHSDRSALDQVLAEQGVKQMAPLFPLMSSPGKLGPEKAADVFGLSHIYRLRLEPGRDVRKVVAALAANPDVVYAEPDYIARQADAPDDPRYSEQWALNALRIEGAWAVVTGTPAVAIAIVDSGIDLDHPDLAPNLWINPGEIPDNGVDDDSNGFVDDVYGWNFVASTNDVGDDNGHGTLVAGVAAARTDNSTGIAGVCGQCRIMPVKVVQTSGVANYSDIAAGVAYAAAKGARVINLSLGGYADSQTLRDAIAYAASQNVVVVGGAGNDDTSSPFYPAAYNEVLAVAGATDTDTRMAVTNYGPWVDVSAPGEEILTTALGGDYVRTSGTSLAASYGAGLGGLLLALHPDWTPVLVQAQLMHTADPIDALNPGYEGQLGNGRLNATQAVQPPVPRLTYAGYSADGTPGRRPDFGTGVELTVDIHNDWADAENVTGTLSTSDTYITVVSDTVTYGGLSAGQTVANGVPFSITIGAAAGYNHPIPFNLALVANQGAYTTTLTFTVTTRSSLEPVAGTIASNTVWTSDKTYVVNADVGIAPGVTLTIEPGTVVQFDGNYELNVGGTLIADGGPDQPIVFRSNSAATWNRIHFADPSTDAEVDVQGTYQSGTVLRYVQVEGAANGLVCSRATPYLAHLAVDGGGIDCLLGIPSFWLRNSTVTGDVSVGTASVATSNDVPGSLSTVTSTSAGEGQKIAFVSDRDGRPQIYIMDPDGSNQTRLSTDGSAVGPRWSPDGTQILFSSRFPGEDTSISVMYRDGSNIVTLLKDYHDGGLLNDLQDPAWSADGSKIVFAASRCCTPDQGSYDHGLYVMDADGSNIMQLTNDPSDSSPVWSPDGAKIAFNRAPPGANREIFVMNLDGSNVTNLTNSEFDDVGPAWSPDGTKIAFEYLTDAWIMSADGSDRIDIGGNGDQSRLDWSPDGTKLAFTMYKCPTSGCADNNNEIWVMDADGANRVNITNHPSSDCCSGWSPSVLQPLPATNPFTYHVWQSTIHDGSLTLPGASEVLTNSIGGGISVGDESIVQTTSAGGAITINGDGTVVSSTVTDGGIHVDGAAWVADNRITTGECDWGVGVGSPAEVRGNRIRSLGLCAFAYGIRGTIDITITGNTVWGFDTGIKLDSGLVRGNLIHGNSQGLETSSATVISNTFTGTTDRALYIAEGVPPQIEGNNFEFNPGPYDVYNDNPAGSNVIAQHNWWGTTETTAIANRIYDFNDDWTKGQVDYAPVLSVPSADAPAYVRAITLAPESPVGIQTVAFGVEFSREMDPTINPSVQFYTTRRGTWEQYTTSNSGLPSDYVYDIAIDGDGVKWFGTDQGVASFDGTTWTIYNSSNSDLPGDNVRAIAIDGDGVKWFGTDQGVASLDGDTWSTYNTFNSDLPSNDVRAIAIDGDRVKWFGVDQSVASFDGTIWTVYNASNSGLPSDYIHDIAIDGDGTKWFGTDDQGVVSFDGVTWTVYNSSNSGLPSDYARTVAVDEGGIKWFGTHEGVARFDGVAWTIYNPSNSGLSSSFVRTIAIDEAGNKWFGLGDPAYYKVGELRSDGTWRTYSIPGTSSAAMYDFDSIAIDGRDNKWLGTSSYPLDGVRVLYGGSDYLVTANSEWVEPTRYSASHDINALIPRGTYSVTVQGAVGADGIEIVPNSAHTFTVDYAGYIADTSPPDPPNVTAWGDGTTTTLSAHWSASDSESAITLYRYSIGTTPGGTDVVNWTSVGVTEVVHSGLNLLVGQTYYVSVQARNESGLWSEPGASEGVVAGIATCDLVGSDGIITAEDIQAVVARWRERLGLPYDRNDDNWVTVTDIMWYVVRWGQGCP